ncbi:MAG: hypothetical protein ABI347_01795 [Nitrososphaera sp.]|jgi:hypothetical protein
MSETKLVGVSDVRDRFSQLREAYAKVLPKVDRALLNDLLEREKSSTRLAYTIEVFTREGVDVEEARQYIMRKTGMAPAIFDNGTHYVTNQILTLEMLKEISDSDDALEIHGNFCGGVGMKGAHFERVR